MTRTTRASGAWASWVLALALGVAAPGAARAQSRQTRSEVPAPSLTAPSLKRRLGVDLAEALLKSPESEERQRGFERLSALGTAQALDLLLKVFEPGGAARSTRDRLVAVRALAPHAQVPAVRELLVRVMVGVGSNPERPEAIDGLIERAAALSLAATGDDAALSALSKALRQSGHVADTARDALLAFPPRHLSPVVQGRGTPSKMLVRLLDQLGDPRAIPALREIVQSAAPDVRADAAVALARFGVVETGELARHWLTHETAPELRLGAARILLQLGAPDAADAVRQLFSSEQTQSAALELAASASLPALTTALSALTAKAEREQRSVLFSALGLAGTREAFSFLGGALSARETSSAAALALALAPGKDAELTLSAALEAPATRRAAVRASIARTAALGRAVPGLDQALTALSRSGDRADQAVLFQATAASSPERASELLKRASAGEVRALARDALLPGVASTLARRLASEPDERLRAALSSCLVSSEAAELVPTNVLLGLVDARGLAAPLAARALAVRDSPNLRPKILDLLQSEDPLLRSHVALGLGDSSESSALGLLERAYRFETNDDVRLAIVRALSARHEHARTRTLDLARRLDGSADVREAAALALAGSVPTSGKGGPGGRASAWLDFTPPAGSSEPARAEPAAALVIVAGGLAVPAFADPDGVLLLPALPTGPLSWRLAAPDGTDDASSARPP